MVDPYLDDDYTAAVPVPDAGADTLRDELIEASVVVWQQRSDDRITASPTEHCAAMADALLPLIREHVQRARANALREMADEADMAIDDEMQPEYPGREVAKWLRKRADRIEAAHG